MANSRQTITLPGSGSRQILDKFLTESGDQLLLESGAGFLGLEEGGGFAVQSTAIYGLSDYALTVDLVEGFTLEVDLANSQQDIVLEDRMVVWKTGGPNSSQNIRVQV